MCIPSLSAASWALGVIIEKWGEESLAAVCQRAH